MRRASLALLVFATALLIPSHAQAVCHAFTANVSPSTATEGGRVTVTVSRDGAVNPSEVHVSTIDESARAPSDYSRLDRQVQFTNDTSQSFQVTIANDAATEGAETFRVHLSNPSGCQANTNYQLGPDRRVTIQSSDPTSPPTAPPGPRVTARSTAPPAATAATPSPTPSQSPTPTPSTSPSFSPSFAQPEEAETGNGLPVWPVIGLLAGGLAAAGGAAILWYRRRMA